MNKHLRTSFAFLLLVTAMLACVSPIPPAVPAPPNAGTAIPPSSPNPNQVGTVVALTLTALAPPEESTAVVPTVTATGDSSSAALPHSFYYLNKDSAGLLQVFRIETDGVTQRQITSEPADVSDYDVSLADGSVAYVANNQLVLVNADGSNRQVLVDGGVMDVNNPFLNNLSSPVFSPDGQSLAYGFQGLQIYNFSTGASALIMKNQIDDLGGGLFIPREMYSPERYAPDGTKLLVTLSYYEGASSAIYYPGTNKFVRLVGGEDALICCDGTEWSADSSSVYAANPSMGMFSAGLWKVDAASGNVTTLIPGYVGDSSYQAADEAYLAPDGQLYFFFAAATSPDGRFPLRLVRSAPDGVTGRTVISEQDFLLLNEALWAPDASFVVANLASFPEEYQGGRAEIVFLDGRPNVVLAPAALQMKWGP